MMVLFVVGVSSSVLSQDRVGLAAGGLYTPEQAEQGEMGYRQACASCHGDMLEGQGQTPSLEGDEFTGRWNDLPLVELFDKIQTTMPADRPGQLSREENAKILAYILKANKFPSGSQALPASADALKGMRFQAAAAGGK
jgi:mono/diheme cytochrome c family protein